MFLRCFWIYFLVAALIPRVPMSGGGRILLENEKTEGGQNGQLIEQPKTYTLSANKISCCVSEIFFVRRDHAPDIGTRKNVSEPLKKHCSITLATCTAGQVWLWVIMKCITNKGNLVDNTGKYV